MALLIGIEMAKYNATLQDGTEIYIPSWTPTVAIENLTQAGKYIGADNMVAISELDVPVVMVAITNAEDRKATMGLIKNFICAARMDGEKITPQTFDSQFEDNLFKLIEIFAHVVKAQYASFFVQGLAKETSPNS